MTAFRLARCHALLDRIGTGVREDDLKAMPNTGRRNSRTALSRVPGVLLSLWVVIALLLPVLPAAAASDASAAPGSECAAVTASEVHCASVCQPAVPVKSADQQTPSCLGDVPAADGRKQVASSLASIARPIRFFGRSGQRIYLRYHRLLL